MSKIKRYYRPGTVEEALQYLAQGGTSTALLAGGSSLIAQGGDRLEAVVDLQDLGLDTITLSENSLTLGAMVRLQQLCESPDVPSAIQNAAYFEGPNTFRNIGTVGGVVVSADWQSELYAALLVHEARVTIQSQGGTRIVPLTELALTGFDREIVKAVTIQSEGETAHERLARTPADKPIVAVIGRRTADGALWLAFCGVADKPVLLDPDRVSAIDPPVDFLGSAAFRREMADILSRRVLNQLN